VEMVSCVRLWPSARSSVPQLNSKIVCRQEPEWELCVQGGTQTRSTGAMTQTTPHRRLCMV